MLAMNREQSRMSGVCSVTPFLHWASADRAQKRRPGNTLHIAQPAPFPLYGVTDPVSAATHLLGALVIASVTPILIRGARPWPRVSILVFCLSAVLLLGCSTAFHWCPPGEARFALQRLDHAAIFILIAGTFTPVHALLFAGLARWGMILLIWLIAVIGIALKVTFFDMFPPWLGIGIYVAMGWLGLYAMVALFKRYNAAFIWPMVLGGLLYTIGAAVELVNWPTLWVGVVRPHELFHLAVLGGLASHWWFIYRASRLVAHSPIEMHLTAIANETVSQDHCGEPDTAM